MDDTTAVGTNTATTGTATARPPDRRAYSLDTVRTDGGIDTDTDTRPAAASRKTAATATVTQRPGIATIPQQP